MFASEVKGLENVTGVKSKSVPHNLHPMSQVWRTVSWRRSVEGAEKASPGSRKGRVGKEGPGLSKGVSRYSLIFSEFLPKGFEVASGKVWQILQN